MKLTEFKSLKVGDTVYAVINTGMAGIFQYQYIGVFIDHANKEKKHVFLSPHFVSTICILYDRTEQSRSLNRIFLTEKEAKDCKKMLIDQDEEF